MYLILSGITLGKCNNIIEELEFTDSSQILDVKNLGVNLMTFRQPMFILGPILILISVCILGASVSIHISGLEGSYIRDAERNGVAGFYDRRGAFGNFVRIFKGKCIWNWVLPT